MPNEIKRGYVPATWALGVAWLILTAPWLSGAVTIPYDAKALFQAQIQFLANAFHSGQSPFWNPNTYVGTPQIADPQSLIFTPAVLLAYFEKTPSFRELDLYVFVLLGMGAFGILKFFKDRQWHPAGGIVAAIAFGFGGSAAWRVQHIAQIQSYAFFGLTLWLLQRALDRNSCTYGAFAGLAAGLMVAAPDQVALLGCYVLAAVVAAHWLSSRDRYCAIKASLGPLTMGGLAATLVAGLPLLMTFLFLASSNRPEMAISEAAHGSIHPASLLTAVVGDLYGALDSKVDYWGPFSAHWDANELTLSQNMSQLYLGSLPIVVLLSVGLLRGALKSREIRVYVAALVALTIYALGTNTPAFAAFYKFVPGVAFFRRPADATFLAGAMASIVGGYLVHLWASQMLPPASLWRRRAEAVVVLLPLAAGLAVATTLGKFDVAWQPTLSALAWIAATSLLLAIPSQWRHGYSPGLIVVVATLLTADLATNNRPNGSTGLPTSSYDILRPDCVNKTVRLLKDKLRRDSGSPWRDRIELVGLGFEWPNATMVHGFDHTLGYNPLRMGIVSDAVGARDYIVGPEQRTFAPLFPSYHSMLSNLLGLRLIASSIPIERVDTTLKPGDLNLIARTEDGYLYENTGALPRAMFVPGWRTADFSRIVKNGTWPDFQPTSTVLLETPPADLQAPFDPGNAGLASIRMTSYRNTEVFLEIDTPRSGIVVLNDLWHRWWRVDVDGQPRPMLKANVMFRAVQVAAGRHRIHFEFAPVAGAVEELREKLFKGGESGPIEITTR